MAIAGDVTEPGDPARMVEAAHDRLGPLDLVFYAAGTAPLCPMVLATADDWSRTFATNVTGANQVLAAAVPCMAEAGILAVLSSETVGRPRHGLGVYGASKAALEESMRSWRTEHTGLRFSSIAVGATQPTEFGDGFDDEHLVPALEAWSHNGLLQEVFMDTDEVGALLVDTFANALRYPNLSVDHLLLRSPSPVVGMSTFITTTVKESGADRGRG
jgi:NAD(P)-dependent dehydrogenase (short-subunit alcohol dehydrogenase family)